MNRPSIIKLTAGIALAVIAGVLAVSQAFSQELAVQRVTIAPGAQGTVAVNALDIGSPGLGAWEIDVIYDGGLVTPLTCEAMAGSVCNPNFAASTIRITGATAAGHVGDTTLATITFQCGAAEGSSGLGLSVAVFADATIGDPRPISHTVQNGSVSCAEGGGVTPPTTHPPSTPANGEATATPTAGGAGPQLPDTGSGSSSGGAGGWLIAALATSGFALAAGFGALRLRRRPSS